MKSHRLINESTLPKSSILVCIPTDKLADLYLLIVSSNIKPDTVLILRMKEYWGEALTLEKAAMRYRKNVDVVDLHAKDPNDLCSEITEIIKSYPNESNLIVHSDGPTHIRFVLENISNELEIPKIAVSHTGNEGVLLINDKIQTFPLNGRINIQEQFQLNKFFVYPPGAESMFSMESDEIRSLRNLLVNDTEKFSKAIGVINKYASKAARLETLSVDMHHDYDECTAELIEAMIKAGIIRIEKNKMIFTSHRALCFANGGWLEDFIFDVVNDQLKTDSWKNMQISSQTRSLNELDVAFINNNKLHIIECKTRNFLGESIGSDALYKLHTLIQITGGKGKGMIVSYRPIDTRTTKRAKDFGISLIGPDDLPSVGKILQEWMTEE